MMHHMKDLQKSAIAVIIAWAGSDAIKVKSVSVSLYILTIRELVGVDKYTIYMYH